MSAPTASAPQPTSQTAVNTAAGANTTSAAQPQQPTEISTRSKQKAEASKAFLEGHYLGMLRNMSTGSESRPINEPRPKELGPSDFEQVKIVGRGAFGEVFICTLKGDTTPGALYAMKRMKKSDMLRKRKVFHVRSERNVLAQANRGSPWIVDLHYSFQDDYYLYMVMDYMPGGDLMTWLCNEGIFSVAAAKCYIAELCVAVDSVHQMEYVHRDIKPDNILMDIHGHTKLSDFGLCKAFPKDGDGTVVDLYSTLEAEQQQLQQQQSLRGEGSVLSSQGSSSTGASPGGNSQQVQPSLLTQESGRQTPPGNAGGSAAAGGNSPPQQQQQQRRVQFNSIVGSPGYIAPEILLRKAYTQNCDWWSVGVIMYEMLYGRTPFYHEDGQRTCHMITHFGEYLKFPENRGVPHSAVSLLKRLLCSQEQRATMAEIREHAFFEDVDWENLRTATPAYKPSLSDPLDVRYFPPQEDLVRPVAKGQNANGLTAADELVKVEDPRGVLFADFKFDYRRAQRKQSGAGLSPLPTEDEV